jgi:glucosamine--fructose-6-phosphate aminotransferase (isomerizing)
MIERPIDEMLEDMRLDRDEVLAEWHRLQREMEACIGDPSGHLWWVGCGDPYFAAEAMQWALQRSGRLSTACEALEFRYAIEAVKPGDMVIGISHSGRVARTREALANAARRGAHTVAVTGRADAPIAEDAQDIVLLGLPAKGLAPGTKTYLNMLMSVLAVTGISARRSERVVGALTAMVAAVPHWTAAAQAWASEVKPDRAIHVLGSGPNRASALFGAAKFWEGAQADAYAQTVEEWAHGQYFVSGPEQPVVIVAPRGRSYGRAVEIAREARYVKAHVTVITDAAEPFQELGCMVLPIPATDEELSPLMVTGPLSLMGYALAKVRGKSSYNFPSVEVEQEHYDTLHNSLRWDVREIGDE